VCFAIEGRSDGGSGGATRWSSGSVDQTDEFGFENFEQTGCNNIAYQDVYASEGSVFGIFEELSDSFRDLQERVESDPRVVEFNSQWQTCIGESGYDYDSPESAMQVLGQRSARLLQPATVDVEVQAEIEADEIAFALVSLDCGVPPPLVGQPQIFLDVRYELELAMIEANQEIFDQFGDLGR